MVMVMVAPLGRRAQTIAPGCYGRGSEPKQHALMRDGAAQHKAAQGIGPLAGR